jgi:hypothetical protein
VAAGALGWATARGAPTGGCCPTPCIPPGGSFSSLLLFCCGYGGGINPNQYLIGFWGWFCGLIQVKHFRRTVLDIFNGLHTNLCFDDELFQSTKLVAPFSNLVDLG